VSSYLPLLYEDLILLYVSSYSYISVLILLYVSSYLLDSESLPLLELIAYPTDNIYALIQVVHKPFTNLTSAYVSMRQHTSAYVSIRQHTSAYVSIRQHIYALIQVVHKPFPAALTVKHIHVYASQLMYI
jgi:hypothetical protein